MAVKQRKPATSALGVKRGGRAIRLTPEQRSENTRRSGDARESVRANSRLSTSKQALHICLKRLKSAQDGSQIRRLTDELQRIVFHRQYRTAEN
jgi:hypothetical protein